MEGKVIPFRHPGQERRRISIFLAVLAVLALILAFFVVDGGRNWDRVRQFFAYGTGELRISMDTGTGTVEELHGDLVTTGTDGVTLYDKDGNVQFVAAASMMNPALRTGGNLILAYDAGRTALLLLDRKGTVRLEQVTSGAILDADLTDDGILCYVTAGETTKAELQVFDAQQLPFFTVHAATRYLTTCAAAPGGETVCAVALGEQEGAFAATAVVYRTDREEPVAEIPLGNQLIYDLKYWGKDRICALGEEELLIFSTDGDIKGRYATAGVTDFDLNGDGFAVLVFAGNGSDSLVTVNAKGAEVARLELPAGVADVCARGKYVAWLTGEELTISGKKLEAWTVEQDVGAAGRVQVCADGIAYLVDSRGATRVLP